MEHSEPAAHDDDDDVYLPTPAEIRQWTRHFQDQWSFPVEMKRRGWRKPPPNWCPPLITGMDSLPDESLAPQEDAEETP